MNNVLEDGANQEEPVRQTKLHKPRHESRNSQTSWSRVAMEFISGKW